MLLVRQPGPWLAAFFVWFAVLWWFSSGVPPFPQSLKFTASDKVLHFGYFFGGAGLLSAALFLRNPESRTERRVITSVIIVSLVGLIDEFHQSFVPGRFGNDPLDFIADCLGAIAGSLTFQPCRRFFR